MSVFMQWNMRGLQANREELSLLLSQYHPTAVCIQETLLRNKTASFKNYSYYGIPAVENNSSLHPFPLGILFPCTSLIQSIQWLQIRRDVSCWADTRALYYTGVD